MDQIVIKKSYFDDIKILIDKINSFFSSGFKTKDFPDYDEFDEHDTASIMEIIKWLDMVDPTWINNQDKIDSSINNIKELIGDEPNPIEYLEENNKDTTELYSFIGLKVLQFIADHFTDFNNLVNGIYTMELFIRPSKYKSTIDIFTKPVNIYEIDLSETPIILFDKSKFVENVFDNANITLPKTMKMEQEQQRLENLTDSNNVEIIIDETIQQESADVTAFIGKDPKSSHIKYDEKTNKFKISRQFDSIVSKLVSGLEKCDTLDDLAKYFQTNANAADIIGTVAPAILVRVFNNTKKFPFDTYDTNANGKYVKAYKKIMSENKGAARFGTHDLFSTFKIDKTGTIKFIKDFLTLNLVNDENCAITNNTLLTIFNIFDSRIYLSIIYDTIPENVKKELYPTIDEFVKIIRGRINRVSRTANLYKDNDVVDDTTTSNDTESVLEYTNTMLKSLGDMSLNDMQYCEYFEYLTKQQISCLDNIMYNSCYSEAAIDKYVGKSYNIVQEGFISNLLDKHKMKKSIKHLEEIENKYNIKFSEEYKEFSSGSKTIESIVGADDAILINHMFNFISTDTKEWNENISKSPEKGMYPIGAVWTGYLDYDSSIDIDNSIIYSDAEGIVYTNTLATNDTNIKKIAISITDFLKNIFQLTVKIPKQLRSFNMKLYYVDDSKDSGEIDREYKCKGSLIGATDNGATMNLYPYSNIVGYIGDLDSSDSFGEYMRDVVLRGINYVLREKDTDGLYEKYMNDHPDENLADLIKVTEVTFKEKPNDPKSYAVQYHINLTFNDKITLVVSHINCKNTQIAYYDSNDTEHVAESYNIVQEVEMGDIPDYMKTRIHLSDTNGDTPNVTTSNVPTPPDNSVDDLVSSIDARLNAGGDLEDRLGSGYEDNPNKNNSEGKVVYNITKNYYNSFNRDSNNMHSHNDLSSGKTITNNNTNSNNDSSNNKTISQDSSHRNNRGRGTNNYYNSSNLDDTKDINNDESHFTEGVYSTGYTIDEVCTFLESEEPLSSGVGSTKPPKGDLLTTAMDADRATLSAQQSGKRKVQKVVNTGKALLKPVTRTKQWLLKVTDSLIKRDEDTVKAEIIENPSYRTALYKAMRVSLNFGLTGLAFTINGYLGAAYVVVQGAKALDKQRLKKEVQEEFTTELKILEDKIERASQEDTPESRRALYQMMRLKSKMERMVINVPRDHIKHPSSLA